MAKILMKGNEAVGEAMIQAGMKTYFAYQIGRASCRERV